MANKITGLDQLQAKFEKLNDIKSISFEELFPDSFLEHYTNSKNLKDFLEKSGFTINSKEDFEAIPDQHWEKYVIANTQFLSWNEMQQSAHEIWIKKWLRDNEID